MDKLTNTNNVKLTKVLSNNINLFRQRFINDETIFFREFDNNTLLNINFCAIYIPDLVDKKILDEFAIKPLMEKDFKSILQQSNKKYNSFTSLIIKKVVTEAEISTSKSLQDIIDQILYGYTAFLIEGCDEAVIVNTKEIKSRSIDEPDTESVIKGPRQGFNESLSTNISLVRKIIRTSKLKILFMEVGANTKTKMAICYIEDIASEKILQELKERLKKIDNGEIFYNQSINEYINDSPLSLFDTIGNTERPDVFCSKISEGRIGILTDGTPFALTIPHLFIEYFQTVDDYTNNYLFAAFNRILRLLAFFIAISVPALYTAIVNFHQELIPTPLLLSIAIARDGLPFPTLLEALVMILGFDILREAGVRLPKPVGQTVSIVGALVLGEAVVNARIVSAPMVIITAITGISSFLVPRFLPVFTILRMVFLLVSGFMGIYGYFFCIVGLFIYLMTLRSFGVPYMLYSMNIKLKDIKSTAVRVPWYMMYNRSKFSSKKNIKRRSNMT
ncbi:spore germination protein [Candidatus Clostridium radicumherbarum]|uniref:Spore germination protein n=1 Tax=Candidatus Clostridium radicumherbarum TaxID=3381662 RepID=A0ABW8TUW9_9CLOT